MRKCPYCDFNSHPLGRSLDQNGYIKSLISDLDFELSQFPLTRPLVSIFMGGGTPSLFDADAMHDLLQQIEQRIPFDEAIEITMEANPGTTEHHDFSGYRQAGINRLSIGVQSFNSAQLKVLGRIHSADDASQAVTAAQAGGFDNINIDLMFGLPEQTNNQAKDDLLQALRLEPQHISLYQLTLEPNTVFHRYPPTLPSQDEIADMQLALQSNLQQEGFNQYEVSAYSQQGRQCLHNKHYWQFGDYLGIGAGAHSKLTLNNQIIRRARKKHPASFIVAAGCPDAVGEQRNVAQKEILFEFLMNGLRLKDGFSLTMSAQRTGVTAACVLQQLEPFLSNGMLHHENGWIRCSQKGFLFLDDILAAIV